MYKNVFLNIFKFRKKPPVPKGGEPHPVLLLFAPFGDDKRVSVTIRRFHSLRSFHPRLFTFAPFGDGRMLLAKLQLFILLKPDGPYALIRCKGTKKWGETDMN